MVKCPRCNCELSNIDTVNSEYTGDSYFDYMLGDCPKCSTVYRWTEQYKFYGISDFEVEEEGAVD